MVDDYRMDRAIAWLHLNEKNRRRALESYEKAGQCVLDEYNPLPYEALSMAHDALERATTALEIAELRYREAISY